MKGIQGSPIDRAIANKLLLAATAALPLCFAPSIAAAQGGDLGNFVDQRKKDFDKGANDAKKIGGKALDAGHQAIAGAGQAGHDAIAGAGQAGHQLIAGAGQAGHGIIGGVGDTIRTAAGDTVTTVQKAGGDTVATVQKAGSDTVATYTKGWRDTIAQDQRSFQDAVGAGQAVIRFEGRQLDAHGQALRNARGRLYDGKLVDAAWGMATEPAQASEENFFKTTQESSVINQAASAAAAYYGGPAGAAAYAAWQTYRTTGDANLAIRAGVLSGLESEAGGAVNGMPTGTTGELIKKSIVAGAVGGLAVAASGGDETAIRNGFIQAGGAVLVQGGSERLEAYSPRSQDALEAAHCIAAESLSCLANTRYARDAKGKILLDANGKPRIDTSAFDAAQHPGSWAASQLPPDAAKALATVTAISKIPNTEAVPILKNQWVVSWNFAVHRAVPYATPQVVLTYVGGAPPFRYTATYAPAPRPGGK